VFTTSWGPNDPVHLFLADGRGGYVDRTAASGLKGIVGGVNTVHADYDNDGDIDILVLRGGWLGEAGKYPNSLLRNRGDATFEDVTFSSAFCRSTPRIPPPGPTSTSTATSIYSSATSRAHRQEGHRIGPSCSSTTGTAPSARSRVR